MQERTQKLTLLLIIIILLIALVSWQIYSVVTRMQGPCRPQIKDYCESRYVSYYLNTTE